MRRALFIREFRSALLPNLITVGAILGTLLVLERIYRLRLGKAEDLSVYIDYCLLVALVISGFISGERCFPTEFKQQRMPFLFSLPISRNWAWLSMVSGRLSAALASIGLAAVLRYSMGEVQPVGYLSLGIIFLISAIVLLCYVLFFVAGTAFALLFQRPLFTYSIGYFLLCIILVEIFLASIYLAIPPYLGVRVLSDLGVLSAGSPPPGYLFAPMGLLLLFFSLLSWRFFALGELGNPKRRGKNQVLAVFTMAAYLGIVFWGTANVRLASIHDVWTWRQIDPFSKNQPCGVSSNGEYLFVLETLDQSPFISRVSVLETRTGRIHGQAVYGGVFRGFWSEGKEILSLLVLNNSPLSRWGYLIPGTMEWVRLTPELQEISSKKFKEVTELEVLADGRAIVFSGEGPERRSLLLNGLSGRVSDITSFVLKEDVPYWNLEEFAKVQSELQRRFPPPSKGGASAKGSFLLPPLHPEINPPRLYFLAKDDLHAKTLWVRSSSPEGHWERLPDLSPSLVFEKTSRRGGRVEFPIGNAINFSSGVAAFLTTNDAYETRLFVYDPRVGVTLGPAVCASGEGGYLYTDRVPGLDGVLIVLNCLGKTERKYFFEYLATSREIRTVRPWALESRALYFDEKGQRVWLSDAGKIWSSLPSGQEVPLWPREQRRHSR